MYLTAEVLGNASTALWQHVCTQKGGIIPNAMWCQIIHNIVIGNLITDDMVDVQKDQ